MSGFVPIAWGPKGSQKNKDIMADLKKNNPKLYSKFAVEARLKTKFPYQDFGHVYKLRGTPEGIAYYGDNYVVANEQQKRHRADDGWYGKGYYSNAGYSGGGSYHRKHHPDYQKGWNQFKQGVKDVGHMVGPKILGAAENAVVRGIEMFGGGSYDQLGHESNEPGILGQHSGNFDSSLFGNKVSHNSLINNHKSKIGMHNVRDESNSIVLTHTEFIGDITPNTTAFQSQYFLAVNPGLKGTFPWLANIAQFYEEYEFEQLAFTFKSMVTEGNATASGTVIMATQYNPANPQFSSKQTMENYDYAQSMKVTHDAHHGIECDISKRGGNAVEYIRTGPVPAGQDLKTYDLATFQVATTGSSSLNIGELWVSYKIRLSKTKIPPALINVPIYGIGNVTSFNATNLVALAGSFTTTFSNTDTGTGSFSGSGQTFSFPVNIVSGKFLVDLYYSNITIVPSTQFTISGNGSTTNVVILRQSIASVAGQHYVVQCGVTITGGSAAVNFGGGASLAGTGMQWQATEILGSYN